MNSVKRNWLIGRLAFPFNNMSLGFAVYRLALIGCALVKCLFMVSVIVGCASVPFDEQIPVKEFVLDVERNTIKLVFPNRDFTQKEINLEQVFNTVENDLNRCFDRLGLEFGVQLPPSREKKGKVVVSFVKNYDLLKIDYWHGESESNRTSVVFYLPVDIAKFKDQTTITIHYPSRATLQSGYDSWRNRIEPLKPFEQLVHITYFALDNYKPNIKLERKAVYSGERISIYPVKSILANFDRALTRDYEAPTALGCNNDDNPSLGGGQVTSVWGGGIVTTTVVLKSEKLNDRPCYRFPLSSMSSILHVWATPYRNQTKITYSLLVPYIIDVENGVSLEVQDLKKADALIAQIVDS